MRIAVLQTGTPPPRTLERLGGYGQMFKELLSGPGEDWEIFDVQNGLFPPREGAHDAYLITGSRASANDPLPWIDTLLQRIREIHARGLPLAGICFGHQVVARALGGQVAPNPRGWDLGLVRLEPTAEAGACPWPAKTSGALRIYETHQDMVLRLPPGAVHLASSARTEFEAYGIGRSVFCLQGHPEFDGEVVREIVATLRSGGLIGARGAARALDSLTTAHDRTALRRALRRFLLQGSRDVIDSSGSPRP